MMIDLDGDEYDTGQFIQFELLQKIIAKLVKNNKDLTEKLDDLQAQVTKKDKKLDDLENKYNVTTANQDKRFKGIEITIGKIYSDNKKKVEVKRSSVNMPEPEPEQEPESDPDPKPEIIPSWELEKKKEDEERLKDLEKEIGQLRNEFYEFSKITHHQQTPENQELDKQDYKDSKSEEGKVSKEQDNTIKNITQPATTTTAIPLKDFNLSDEDNQTLEKIITKPNELMTLLFKKVVKNEKKISELEKLNPVLSIHENKILNNEDGIGQSSNKITKIQGDIQDFQKKIDEMGKAFEEIRVKVVDFSIYDLFKDNGDGTIDASKALVSTLESKIFKKFSLIEERLKNVEENNFKIKNDLLEVSNLTNSTHRTTVQAKEKYEKFKETTQEEIHNLNQATSNLDKNLHDFNNQMTNKLNGEIGRLSGLINEKELQLTQNMKDMMDEHAIKGIQSGPSISEGDIKIIKDLSKKVNELEKEIKLLSNTSNNDSKNQQIQNIQAELQNKIGRIDLNELYEKTRYLLTMEKDLNNKTNDLSDNQEKMSTDINFLTKKLETVYGICINIQNNPGDNSSNASRNPILDLSKFIDQARYTENNKIIDKKIELIRLEEEDLRRTINDILKQLKTMPSDNDLKTFEQSILASLEENKFHSIRRFADKIDINKTIRYLETQIKQIIEMYTKKIENGDNWLLAKKPIGNYQCASCDSNIRDLSQKNDYLPWNKYPMRDDKAYRMGHGFSRMLQMVNMDILKTAEMNRDHSSDDEKEQRPLSGNKGKSKLPKVNKGGVTKSVQEVTYSDDDMYSDGVHKPTEPKVIKIYKKIKHVNLETDPK